jgi:large subunit ribosomal protein L4
MASVKLTTPAGKAGKAVDLDDAWFGVEPHLAVMHQVVTAQLAARRAGTQSTKTRAEVRGGGAKPWRQKGTGRARQGSIRSPHWRGGGVSHAPKPRSYAQRTPKKMIRLALASALSDRQADGKVKVLDGWGIDEPSTKAAVEVLGSIGVDGRVLVVLTRDEADIATWKSLRNLGHVHVLNVEELNAYDVLVSDWVVFTQASLPARRTEPQDAAPAEAAKPAAKATKATKATKAAKAGSDDADAAAEDAEADAEAAKPAAKATRASKATKAAKAADAEAADSEADSDSDADADGEGSDDK